MGLTVLGAGVVIGLLDAGDAHHATCKAALHSAEESAERLLLPASALTEVLVGPLRHGTGGTVDRFLKAAAVSVVAADEAVARQAAELRAISSIRVPDALIVATAIAVRADQLLTTDARWPAVVTGRFPGVLRVFGEESIVKAL